MTLFSPDPALHLAIGNVLTQGLSGTTEDRGTDAEETDVLWGLNQEDVAEVRIPSDVMVSRARAARAEKRYVISTNGIK